jgi:TatA/E family protein of Tat protein translocase
VLFVLPELPVFAFLGTQEVVVVLVLALIVFGPQKLPEIGKQIGSAMRELRNISGEMQRALDFDDYGPHSPPAYEATRWDDTTYGSAEELPLTNTVLSAAVLIAPPGPRGKTALAGNADPINESLGKEEKTI